MQWIKQKLNYIMLGFFLLTNAVIMTEASLSGGPSGARSGFISLLLSIFVNKTVPNVDPEFVPLETMTVRDHELNAVSEGMTYYIPLGVTRRFVVNLAPATTSDKSLTWTTSNPAVLEVYPGGYLEARGIGSDVLVTLTPSLPSQKLSFYVTVHEKLAPPTFNATLAKNTIDVGTTTTLDIDLSVQSAREYDPSKLTFISDNPLVASVNNYGVIKGLSAGSTTIRVDGHPETYPLTVKDPATPVVTAESITLSLVNNGYVYDKTPLNFTFDKENVTDPSVTVTTSNPAVATIIKEDDAYFVYGNKVAGSATITVYYNTDFLVRASHVIVMENVLPTAISLSASKTEFNAGATITISQSLSHALLNKPDVPVTDQRLTYTSSDTTVATVASGNLSATVLGIKPGTVIITAVSVADPSVTTSLTLKITPTPFINDTNFTDFQAFVRKALGHFMLFFVNGFFGFYTFYLFFKDKRLKKTIIYSLMVGLISAALSEVIQLFVPGRAGSIIDVIIDFSGYLTITLLLFLITYLYHKAQKKKKPLPEPKL